MNLLGLVAEASTSLRSADATAQRPKRRGDGDRGEVEVLEGLASFRPSIIAATLLMSAVDTCKPKVTSPGTLPRTSAGGAIAQRHAVEAMTLRWAAAKASTQPLSQETL